MAHAELTQAAAGEAIDRITARQLQDAGEGDEKKRCEHEREHHRAPSIASYPAHRFTSPREIALERSGTVVEKRNGMLTG